MDRDEQSQALRDLTDLVALVADLPEIEKELRKVIMRGRFTTGQRKHTPGELGEMVGTTGTIYSDTTGDDAVWDEMSDRVSKTISGMAKNLRKIQNDAKTILAMKPKEPVANTPRIVPDCLVCGDPIVGKNHGGFDDKCRMRWVRDGRPDRVHFAVRVKTEIQQKANVHSEENQL